MPYVVTWTNVAVGDYVLTARATDDGGLTAVSDPVHVAVSDLSADVAVVANPGDSETTRLQDYLFEMGLSSRVFDQAGLTFEALQRFKLIVWDGLTEGTQNLADKTVGIFQRAFTNGTPLYFIGEGLAAASNSLSEPARSDWTGLIHLKPVMTKDGIGTVSIVAGSEAAPILRGRFGTVMDFSYPNAVDRTTVATPEAGVIGASGGSDVLVAFPGPEEVDIGTVRVFTQNVRVTTGQEEASLTARKALFQNVVCWLLRCPTCSAVDVRIEGNTSAENVRVGDQITYSLVVGHSGECEATGTVVTNRLPTGVRFVTADSQKGTWRQEGSLVIFELGHLEKASLTTLTLTVIPSLPGRMTNFAAVRINGPEASLDNNSVELITTVEGSSLNIAPSANGGFQINVTGVAGRSYVIEASTDLVHWTAVANFVSDGEAMQFLDREAANSLWRFYRVVSR